MCVCVYARNAESVQQRNGQERTRKRFETVISTMEGNRRGETSVRCSMSKYDTCKDIGG